MSLFSEAWIEAIQRVAENLQVLDESEFPGCVTDMEQDQDMKKSKKKKVY